jgi:hypothetical protein
LVSVCGVGCSHETPHCPVPATSRPCTCWHGRPKMTRGCLRFVSGRRPRDAALLSLLPAPLCQRCPSRVRPQVSHCPRRGLLPNRVTAVTPLARGRDSRSRTTRTRCVCTAVTHAPPLSPLLSDWGLVFCIPGCMWGPRFTSPSLLCCSAPPLPCWFRSHHVELLAVSCTYSGSTYVGTRTLPASALVCPRVSVPLRPPLCVRPAAPTLVCPSRCCLSMSPPHPRSRTLRARSLTRSWTRQQSSPCVAPRGMLDDCPRYAHAAPSPACACMP